MNPDTEKPLEEQKERQEIKEDLPWEQWKEYVGKAEGKEWVPKGTPFADFYTAVHIESEESKELRIIFGRKYDSKKEISPEQAKEDLHFLEELLEQELEGDYSYELLVKAVKEADSDEARKDFFLTLLRTARGHIMHHLVFLKKHIKDEDE